MQLNKHLENTDKMAKDVPKFGEKEVLQFVGLKDLEPEEQDVVQSLSTEYFGKIKREVHNVTNIIVHVKAAGKVPGAQKRKRYSVKVRSLSPGLSLESSKSDDYELPRAVHQTFEDILTQIKHRLRTDTTRPNSR